jgi:hypothetical protein
MSAAAKAIVIPRRDHCARGAPGLEIIERKLTLVRPGDRGHLEDKFPGDFVDSSIAKEAGLLAAGTGHGRGLMVLRRWQILSHRITGPFLIAASG